LTYQKYLINSIDEHINNETKYEKLYGQSEERLNCIVCNEKISSEDFTRNSIKFSFCNRCGHINGHNILDDSLEAETYTDQSLEGIKYDKYYIQEKEEFEKTIKNIYEPKAQFLFDSLKNFYEHGDFQELRILDFGTGSGHMVRALENIGFRNTYGIDPMKSTIDFGKELMQIQNLARIKASESVKYLLNTKDEIISMICTLPHVAKPNAILNAMNKNPNIKFTYQKLPMFSLGSMFDISHPEINSRVISGTHTHIYTEESLNYIEKKYQLERISEWRFGSDIMDLYRNIEVAIERKKFSSKLSQKFALSLLPLIDQLQIVLDEHNFASEIHVLWKFNR
jgi:SAM-dependent methyltransferase